MSVSSFQANNFSMVEGRVVKDPKILTNADGSRTYLFKLAADRDYVDRDGKRQTDFVSFQGYVAKDNSAKVYDYVKQGNMIKVTSSIQNYTKHTSAKELMETLKKVGITDGATANKVCAAISALNLAKFDEHHNMLVYKESNNVTDIRLGFSSRKNREASESAQADKQADAENTAKTDVQDAKSEDAPAEQMNDSDLPF